MKAAYDKYSIKKTYSAPSAWMPSVSESGKVNKVVYGQLVEPFFSTEGFKYNADFNIVYYELDKYSPVYEIFNGVGSGPSIAKKYVFRESTNDEWVVYADVYVKTAVETIIKDKLMQSDITAEYGTYPDNGVAADGFWYIKKGDINTPPTIGGIDQNLGDKNSPFDVSYIVNDPDLTDTLTVTEKLDNTVINIINNANRSRLYTINITKEMLNKLSLNTSHSITITVEDSGGGKVTRTYTFSRTNNPPIISGSDQHLGSKNDAIEITYQVEDPDGGTIEIEETLNGNVVRNLKEAPQKQDITLTISKEMVLALNLFSMNTIKIKARDSDGYTTIRTYFFSRSNTLPVISDSDKYVGEISEPFAQNYTITHIDNSAVVVTERLDDRVIKTYNCMLGVENLTIIPQQMWLETSLGKHTVTIEAKDAYSSTSIRTYTFVKTDDRIEFTLKNPYKTDIKATKLLIIPTWFINSSKVKVEACNNGFDATKVWEDITSAVLKNEYYKFKNTIKTAENWGVNIRVIINKDLGKQSNIKNMKIWIEQ